MYKSSPVLNSTQEDHEVKLFVKTSFIFEIIVILNMYFVH